MQDQEKRFCNEMACKEGYKMKWLVIAMALYSLFITAILFVEWNKERPSKKFIRSIEKACKGRERHDKR